MTRRSEESALSGVRSQTSLQIERSCYMDCQAHSPS